MPTAELDSRALHLQLSTVSDLQVDARCASPGVEYVAECPVLLAVGGGQELDGDSELVDGDGVAVGPPLPRVEGGRGAR